MTEPELGALGILENWIWYENGDSPVHLANRMFAERNPHGRYCSEIV
jgi:hypothetical protein